MEGYITRIKDSDVWVTVPELGESLRIRKENATNISTNQYVTIGIRPEYIHITDRLGENKILGTVMQVMEGVTTISYYFQTNTDAAVKHDLEASLSKLDAADILDGQSCYFYMPPERLAIITK